MQAYKLVPEVDRFRSYLLANPANQGVLDEIYGKPQGPHWRPIRLKPEWEWQKRLPPGDVPCIFVGPPVLALSEPAVEALRDLLEPVGEFLPLECPEEPLWLYNCTRFADVLDEDESDLRRYKDGGIMHIRRHAWRPEVRQETCFRLPQLHRSAIYGTRTIVDRIRSAGLRGFLFRH